MDKVISKDGTAIAFDRSGQGPAVIVVNGALSTRVAVPPLRALLAQDFSVFAYDRRGRGDSGDTAPYAVEREVEDLEALITEAGGSAFVFGHSSGAVLALEAANRLPGKITKLALYEPPFIVDDMHPKVPDDYVQHLNGLVSSGRRGEAIEYFLITAVTVPAEMVAQMRTMPMWPEMEALAHTLPYDGMVMGDSFYGRPLTKGKWSAATMPMLVMDGGASPPWMHHAAEGLVEVLPHAQHRRLAGQDHGAAPEVLAPLLVEFFKS